MKIDNPAMTHQTGASAEACETQIGFDRPIVSGPSIVGRCSGACAGLDSIEQNVGDLLDHKPGTGAEPTYGGGSCDAIGSILRCLDEL
jgi:hypothetical protein